MADTKITALYCRVACEDGGEIALQEAVLRDYALKQGYSNICTYADNGYIGRDFNRPAFSRMALDIQSGLVSTILVKDISRISRQYPDFINGLAASGKKVSRLYRSKTA